MHVSVFPFTAEVNHFLWSQTIENSARSGQYSLSHSKQSSTYYIECLLTLMLLQSRSCPHTHAHALILTFMPSYLRTLELTLPPSYTRFHALTLTPLRSHSLHFAHTHSTTLTLTKLRSHSLPHAYTDSTTRTLIPLCSHSFPHSHTHSTTLTLIPLCSHSLPHPSPLSLTHTHHAHATTLNNSDLINWVIDWLTAPECRIGNVVVALRSEGTEFAPAYCTLICGAAPALCKGAHEGAWYCPVKGGGYGMSIWLLYILNSYLLELFLKRCTFLLFILTV